VKQVDTELVKTARVSMFVPSAAISGYEECARRYRAILIAGLEGSDLADVQTRLQEVERALLRLNERLTAVRAGGSSHSAMRADEQDDEDDEADLRGAFDACDWNGNGSIDAEELHGMLQAVRPDLAL
jgi:hypothetical protein